MHVLVVDDSAPVRSRLRIMLASLDGVDTVVATSTFNEANLSIAARAPDVAVLDVTLPDGSGLELLRAIRAAGRPVLVIILTNAPEPQLRKAWMAAGADYFLDKATEIQRVAQIVADRARNRT